mgnify:CR=1 FL=1
MTQLAKMFQLKNVSGTAVQTPHGTLIPESQALFIRFPFGGFVWQRPTAVRVQQNNQTHRYPIIDVPRLATWSILAASLLLPLLLRLTKKKTGSSRALK